MSVLCPLTRGEWIEGGITRAQFPLQVHAQIGGTQIEQIEQIAESFEDRAVAHSHGVFFYTLPICLLAPTPQALSDLDNAAAQVGVIQPIHDGLDANCYLNRFITDPNTRVPEEFLRRQSDESIGNAVQAK